MSFLHQPNNTYNHNIYQNHIMYNLTEHIAWLFLRRFISSRSNNMQLQADFDESENFSLSE